MYKIYADNTLIYDSTISDFKLNKAVITLKLNKSGSFSFSLYPDHFYYDGFTKLKTLLTIFKRDKKIFRGRVLNDNINYWNNKVITCEGDLGFFQDSIIRPSAFTGTPREILSRLITEHNNQVDDFKKFNLGTVTLPADSMSFEVTEYETTFNVITKNLIDKLGGYLNITRNDSDLDSIPTLNYLEDFNVVCNQYIEFGQNLRNYTKKIDASNFATAIIPLGADIDIDDGTDEDGNPKTKKETVTIASVNDGIDYLYDADAVATYGWIFKSVDFTDITDAQTLKNKGTEYLESSVKQSITIELTAIDLNLLDRSIESFFIGQYIPVISKPHNFEDMLLCSRQTIDLLKPENDTVTLGDTFKTFVEKTTAISPAQIKKLNNKVDAMSGSTTTAQIIDGVLTLSR